METCFNHTDTAKVATCKYCGKNFCSECLFLQGLLESIMCINCFKVYKKKYTSSISRCYIYAIAGIVLAIIFMLYTIFDYSSFSLILFIIVSGTTVFNFMRIKQMKTALKIKPYTSVNTTL
jgi:hypothetical protein